MATTSVPATELMAAGRLQGLVLLIGDQVKAVVALATAPAMAEERWRVDALAALHTVRMAANHARIVPAGSGREVAERGAIEMAMAEIGSSAAVAEHAVRTAAEPLFLLAARVKLPQAFAAMARVIDALVRMLAVRMAPVTLGFAC